MHSTDMTPLGKSVKTVQGQQSNRVTHEAEASVLASFFVETEKNVGVQLPIVIPVPASPPWKKRNRNDDFGSLIESGKDNYVLLISIFFPSFSCSSLAFGRVTFKTPF